MGLVVGIARLDVELDVMELAVSVDDAVVPSVVVVPACEPLDDAPEAPELEAVGFDEPELPPDWAVPLEGALLVGCWEVEAVEGVADCVVLGECEAPLSWRGAMACSSDVTELTQARARSSAHDRGHVRRMVHRCRESRFRAPWTRSRTPPWLPQQQTIYGSSQTSPLRLPWGHLVLTGNSKRQHREQDP